MASPAARITFRIVIIALVVLVLFYIGRPLYWKISATIHEVRQNRQTVKQGISQIVLEAQKSVGWYHDESDSGARDDRAAKNVRLAGDKKKCFKWETFFSFLNSGAREAEDGGDPATRSRRTAGRRGRRRLLWRRPRLYHGGRTNAYTASENANYYFDVNSDDFEEALDIFAQFFINPLMSADATMREIKAVDSENQNNLLSDGRRMNREERMRLLKRKMKVYFYAARLDHQRWSDGVTVRPILKR